MTNRAYENREPVPCDEDDGTGITQEHDWPDGEWPADQVRPDDDIVQCSNCGWTRLQLAARAAAAELSQRDSRAPAERAP